MDLRSDLDPQKVENSFIFHLFFNVFLIFAVFNIIPDVLWILVPTWLHFNVILEVLGVSWALLDRSWAVLGASWAVLKASWGNMERLRRVLGASWGRLGASWRRLGGVLAVLKASWLAKAPRT